MSMFCYQCQETAKGSGCTVQGVCGKKADVANLQDLLIYTLKGISAYTVEARKAGIATAAADKFVMEGLFATITNANFDKEYFVQTINVFKKWENHLPLSIKSLSDIAKKPRNHNKSQIDRLTKILVRKGFCEAQIIENITYFTTVVGTEKDILRLRYLPLKIKWIRFSSKIRNKK